MKKKISIFAIIFFVMGLSYFSNNSRCQWTQLNGPPYGGTCVGLSSNAINIYSVVNYRIAQYSSNNGTTWTRILETQSGTDNDLRIIKSNENSIIIGTSAIGIYFSSNNGLNWTNYSSDNLQVHSILMNNNDVYVTGETTTSVRKLLYSSNSGLNWSVYQPVNNLYSLALNGGTLFGGGWPTLYKSTNNGQTWTTAATLSGCVQALLSVGNNIFAGTGLYGVFISTNSGLNWSSTSMTNKTVMDLASIGSNVLAATDSGIYLTSNNGVNWIQTSLNNKSINSFTIKGGIVYAGCKYDDDGIFMSSNNGLNWTQIGFNIIPALRLMEFNNRFFLGVAWKGLYSSTNFGTNWIQTSIGTGNEGISSMALNGSTYFAGGFNTPGVYKSTNNGVNWIMTTLNDKNANALTVSGGNIIAGIGSAAGDPGIYTSTNNGVTWSHPFTYYFISSLLTVGSNVFAGTQIGIYKSTDNGISWTITSSSGLTSVGSLSASNNVIYAGTFYAAEGGLYKSTNNGTNWVQTSLSNISIGSIISYGNNVIAGTDSGVYLSTNMGQNWVLRNDGADVKGANSFVINGSYIYACAGSVWRRPLSELTGVISTQEPISSDYCLYQNYPNPFNPATNIRYQIPNNAFVILKIYDVIGKEVAILVNEKQSPGVYEVTFDGSNYPSGIYFYKLSAGDFSEIKKMILIR